MPARVEFGRERGGGQASRGRRHRRFRPPPRRSTARWMQQSQFPAFPAPSSPTSASAASRTTAMSWRGSRPWPTATSAAVHRRRAPHRGGPRHLRQLGRGGPVSRLRPALARWGRGPDRPVPNDDDDRVGVTPHRCGRSNAAPAVDVPGRGPPRGGGPAPSPAGARAAGLTCTYHHPRRSPDEHPLPVRRTGLRLRLAIPPCMVRPAFATGELNEGREGQLQPCIRPLDGSECSRAPMDSAHPAPHHNLGLKGPVSHSGSGDVGPTCLAIIVDSFRATGGGTAAVMYNATRRWLGTRPPW